MKKGFKRPPFSEEWKKNISKALKGRKSWNKNKSGYSTRKKGSKQFSTQGENNPSKRPEVREKIRISKLGNKFGIGKRSPEFRRKLSEIAQERVKKGVHNFWKGGVTELKKKIRKGVEWKLWREAVFKRDNWTCVWCKIRGKELHPDHIKPFSLYPELRFAIDNGRTLCKNCHRKTDTYGSKIRKLKNEIHPVSSIKVIP